ncbi:formyltetrahydrofolate synthetase [Alphaentomopoxvirus acuprea]|uniref:Formyltetrahydrofolate synthetase n=1 Tax=Alphaentomopoxvirus acuprea TaxID=62099 RepID=W6JIN7_9POXV|nr:formyltetrahydrofolate synthetase [Anomala cuprea entomopoxvirus]BAO49407.1 formyltetrahydrofolate synthetase [Anomala cuprea entomopoxvirus]
MNHKIIKYLNNDKDTEITDSHIIVADQIISKTTDKLNIDAKVSFVQDVEFIGEVIFNKMSVNSMVFRNAISELLEEHMNHKTEIDTNNQTIISDNRMDINENIDKNLNHITDDVGGNNEIKSSSIYPNLHEDNKIIIGSDTMVSTVTVMQRFYDRMFSINEFGNNNDHILLIGPNISSQYCIFYLIVYFNSDLINALSYSMNKFYYKMGSKKQFVSLSNEYINEENKAEVKYKNGNIEIKFKFNSSEIKSINIEAYASKC